MHEPPKRYVEQRRPRVKDEKYLTWIRQLACLLCGDNTSTEAAHIRMLDVLVSKRECGKSERPDDRWALPLCGKCHRIQHEQGERYFWAERYVDPIRASLALQVAFLRDDLELAGRIVAAHANRNL
jgi:hypothetical protein